MLDQLLFNSPRKIILGNNEISPGEISKVNYNVGNLPSGTRVAIQMEIFRSIEPGPHILVMGGVHGDEVNGVEIVRRTLENNMYRGLFRGSVIVVPLLNVYGFINFSRDVPDGKDVNRSFPGSRAGSLASRVARILTKNILPQVDIIIDCHSGGQTRFNYPQIRISKEDTDSYELAMAFNPPFLLHKGVLRGSLRKVAKVAQKPCLTYEGGEALRFDGFSINRGVKGIARTLHYLGMVPDPGGSVIPSIEINHTSWVRASQAGIFLWSKCSGAKISKGEPLGNIGDPYGTVKVSVLAPRDGYILGHANAPLVNHGDALFHIGY
jgi:predicted deacylase